MTSDEILMFSSRTDAGENSSARWLKEIAYQLAIANEAAGNYLTDRKELRRRWDLFREPEEIQRDNQCEERIAQNKREVAERAEKAKKAAN